MSKTTSFRLLTAAALAGLLLLWVGSASAAICSNVNTEPFWDGNITNGWLAQAQTFEAPSTSCNMLLNWEFAMAGRSSPGQVTFNIYEWSSGPVGSALYSTVLNWGTSNATYDVNNINVPLIPGQLYGAEVDFQGYTGQSIYFQANQTGYPGFDGWWDNGTWFDFPGLQTYFQANFGSTVPEPGTFIMLVSGVLGAVGVLRRKVL